MKCRKNIFWKSIVFTFVMILTAGSLNTFSKPTSESIEDQIRGMVNQANNQLELSGSEYRIGQADYYTEASANEVGQTIFFNDTGNKQLSSHWVYADARRGGFTDIAYIVDQFDNATGLTLTDTTSAIDRAMTTWNNVKCSDIPITKLGDIPGIDIGFVQFLLGQGGFPFPLADITHGGWISLPPGVLGVTFTFNFVGGDSNNDGKSDTAFREIYYNSNVPWGIDQLVFDVETVALHEAGHSLSQEHFGKLFQTTSNGKFHFAPRSLMNAGYTGIQQSVVKTDKAGHCSIWASWGN